MFGRGTDNALWWRHQTTGTENGYADSCGLSTNSPGTAPILAGLVFARGTDNALWFRPSIVSAGLAALLSSTPGTPPERGLLF